MERVRVSLMAILAVITIVAFPGRSDIPRVISYQGKVTDASGTPVPDNSYLMRFRVYTAPTGGTLLWDSGTQNVPVSGGIFSVVLGESPQPALDLAFDADYWLLATFNGTDQSPRQRVASVGYAYMASGLVPGTEVRGTVTSGTFAALKGTNTATSGMFYGVFGSTSASEGAGVWGEATATTSFCRGVFGKSNSTGGTGVAGHAYATSGVTYGVEGNVSSPSGRGVQGSAWATTGTCYGVYGITVSTGGRGVYGEASAATGTTYGVYGQSASTVGTGVYGRAEATTGTTYGVRGRSDSASGRGVYGWVNSTTGTNYGVYGEVLSPSGWGGYFSGRLCALAAINSWATPTNHVALIHNTSTGTSPDVLALKVGYTGNPGGMINYITFFKGNDAAVGAIEGDGAGGITLLSGGGDFAEYLPRRSGEALEPGDVVGVFEGGVSKHTAGASQLMVVSTRPIVVGNNPGEQEAQNHARVAFIGQVEVKVRGPVSVGDLLVASGLHDGTALAVPRDAMSDAQARHAFAQAWETRSDPGVKRVRAAVGMLQHDPGVAGLKAENASLREELRELRQRVAALEGVR